MADTKITALTAITTVDPAVDVLPIVDVSDTSMAASGTTKKITSNQILGAGGTATLASATITGDLTVATSVLKVDTANTRVGINTTSINGGPFNVKISPSIDAKFVVQDGFTTGNVRLAAVDNAYSTYKIMDYSALSHAWYNSGATAMTLNSTGLGIGVTPSAWDSGFQVIENSGGSFWSGSTGAVRVSQNAYYATSLKYKNALAASQYVQTSGQHQWFYDTGTRVAGTACNFTQAMTLDASGNLLVGTTTNTNSSRVFARGTGGATTLALQSSTGDTANPGLIVGKFDNDSTTSQILVRFSINNNAAGSGQINANGANQAAFGSFSDSRLKENIVNLPSQLANIVSLRPVEFDYKDGSGHQIGFVAQEIQEVYSDAVGEQNGFLTVTGWSKTEARLVSAIKELAAKVQALEAKLA